MGLFLSLPPGLFRVVVFRALIRTHFPSGIQARAGFPPRLTVTSVWSSLRKADDF